MRQAIPTSVPGDELSRVVERPDGFWWQSLDGGREHGPFETLMDALLDLQDAEARTASDADEVRSAGELLGVPEWVDPETGHLADDEHTRIEDH